MTTLGYVRVSTDEQRRDGLSLADQRHAIEQYCELKGLGAPTVLADQGISGTTLRRRPAAQQVVEQVQARQVQHVVATALDRLFRSTLDAVTFFNLARERGCSVHLIREAVDTSTPTGDFVATIMAALAQLESRRTGERIRHVLAYKRDQAGGEPINGKAPYGWRWVPDPAEGHNTLRQDAAEQAVVRQMLAWRSQGESCAAITRRLNERPDLPPRSGRQWHREQVRRILTRYDNGS